MEKSLAEIFLEGCENMATPQNFLQAKIDMLIEGEEMVTGQWTSSYESVQENAKNAMFSDLESQIEQKIIATISKYMPKDQILPYARSFSRDILENIKNTNIHQYDLQKAYNTIQNLVYNTNFFENAFLESAHQGYIGDNDFLFYGITDSEYQNFATQNIDAKKVASALTAFIKKVERRILTADDNITRYQNELIRVEDKLKKVDEQRIAVLKQRKQIRQGLKENPSDLKLPTALEISKQQEATLVSQISDLSKQAKSLKQEISYKTADIKRKIDLKYQFDSMLKNVNSQINTNDDLQLWKPKDYANIVFFL